MPHILLDLGTERLLLARHLSNVSLHKRIPAEPHGPDVGELAANSPPPCTTTRNADCILGALLVALQWALENAPQWAQLLALSFVRAASGASTDFSQVKTPLPSKLPFQVSEDY